MGKHYRSIKLCKFIDCKGVLGIKKNITLSFTGKRNSIIPNTDNDEDLRSFKTMKSTDLNFDFTLFNWHQLEEGI